MNTAVAAIVDRTLLLRRIRSLNVLIRSHAGEIELVELTPDGAVTVRYVGMCAGCDYRPVTTAGTVEPALMDVPGVARVIVAGARVSDEARARITAHFEETDARERAIRLVHEIETRQHEG